MVSTFEDPKSLFNFMVVDGNGVKGIADSGLTTVPSQFVQPPAERIAKLAEPKIHQPAIDLSGLDGPEREEVVARIVRAAKTVGFFQVVNHGVPVELLERVKDAAHAFFQQPAEKKAVYLKGASRSPTVMYGTSFAPEKEEVFEWKDYVFMKYTSDEDAMKHWPSGCKEVALEYLKTSMEMVVKRILGVLIGDLGIPENEQRSVIESLTGLKMVKMNYYPVCPEPDVTIGVRRHSDMDTITVLLQDEVGGLYVRLEQDCEAGKAGEWILIPPLPGALVINVGDTMQIVSNGRYRSAEHRARAANSEARVSIPVFTMPSEETKIGPLRQTVESDGIARYREVVFGDYKSNHLGKPHEGKDSLAFARITPTID